MEQGEIYIADLGNANNHPVIVISRSDLNRGTRVICVMVTSQKFAARSLLPNCVPFQAGQFGLTTNCVAQCENLLNLDKSRLAPQMVGKLDDTAMRNVVLAIGNVIDSYCEPN